VEAPTEHVDGVEDLVGGAKVGASAEVGGDVKSLRRERDCWRTRAGALRQLATRGLPFERWEDERLSSE
jgi:hypothetical protein